MSKLKFSRRYLSIPYGIFLALFVIIPMILIFVYAITKTVPNGSGGTKLIFSFDNIVQIFSNPYNFHTFLISLAIGLGNTIICLLIGFPIAYILAKKEFKFKGFIVMLFVMPMWINFVLRTAATRDLLYWIKLSGGNYPYFATMIGMVYNYLPFTILPLYTTMLKMDQSLIDASMDLGANKTQTFIKTIIPMTLPGIVSAAMMVFMPTMSSFVISDVMAERQISLIGNTIQLYFEHGLWNLGSFIALLMLFIILASMVATRNVEREDAVKGALW